MKLWKQVLLDLLGLIVTVPLFAAFMIIVFEYLAG